MMGVIMSVAVVARKMVKGSLQREVFEEAVGDARGQA